MSDSKSDPITNPEIEDVLSSIRRLVSEDARSSTKPETEDRPEPAHIDRLILTPAQRISEPETDEPTEPVAAKAEGASSTPLVLESANPEVAEPEVVNTDIGEEPVDAEQEVVEEGAAVNAAADEALEMAEAADDALESDPVEAEVSEVATVPEVPLVADAPFVMVEEPEDAEPAPSAEPARFSSVREVPRAEPSSAPQAEEPATDGDALETEIAGADWMNGASASVAGVAGAGHIWEETAVPPTSVEPAAPEDATAPAQEIPGDVDEEVLRRLVAEILRQELQGPLGERITRNVRKLVRREIFRALSERDAE
ncbi:hypothetical protein [Ostreiculturibacter nitratireducens]|uniref:hypothetical protein n=1 Tax=Ostreiculturibacter nitratireducens TaxID=3075226 RepID=UPI0031B5F0A5